MERWLAPYSFHNFLIRGRDGRGQIEKTRFADSVRDVEMVVLPACSGSATHQASVSLAGLTRFAKGQIVGFVGCTRICASSPIRLPSFLVRTAVRHIGVVCLRERAIPGEFEPHRLRSFRRRMLEIKPVCATLGAVFFPRCKTTKNMCSEFSTTEDL